MMAGRMKRRMQARFCGGRCGGQPGQCLGTTNQTATTRGTGVRERQCHHPAAAEAQRAINIFTQLLRKGRVDKGEDKENDENDNGMTSAGD